MFILEILLWIALFSIFYTYLFYPLLIKFIAGKKQLKYELLPASALPPVSIVMAAHNEEKVIEQKIHSVFGGNYPAHLIEFYVGSDNSTDKTNEILTKLSEEYPQLQISLFSKRQGKINILNQFIPNVSNEVVISTDSNNIFFPDTIHELVSALYSDEQVGLVDILMLHNNLNNDGMSYQENTYISGEARTKYREGVLFGIMSGPFGGCYAFRKKLWITDVPYNFLNDDLFVHFSIVNQQYKSILNYNAKIFEDVSNNPKLEFRRKIRLGAGDFQIFFLFIKNIMNPFTKVGFVTLSHRAIRWFGPFILLFILMATVILCLSLEYNVTYKALLWLEIASVSICFIDEMLRKININLFLVRHLTHFYLSNIAMLLGFFRYIKGVKSSIWIPTQRHQKAK